MTTDRILTVIAIVLGLPGVIALFFTSEHRGQGVLLSLIVAILIVGAWWFRRQQDLTQFKCLELRKTVRIQAENGSLATYERSERMRANFNNISEWWNRGLMQDGTISDILIDNRPPDRIVPNCGGTDVCKLFERPLEKGEEVTVVLTCKHHNSYMTSREALVHTNSSSVAVLTIVVELPRPCTSAEVRRSYSGDHGKLEAPPKMSSNNQRIEACIRKPRMGASYHVEWNW